MAGAQRLTIVFDIEVAGFPWEEVDDRLKTIMRNIHRACVKHGAGHDEHVDYVKGANVAGFPSIQ